jgi:MOSC domain-containing protein YiiM
MTGRKSVQREPGKPRVCSVNVSGELRSVLFAGHRITTGFFKSPLSGMAHARKLGIEGDFQGDLSVHGGPEKAVYFYAREHYAAWEMLLGSGPLPPGSFGENITSEGLLETDLNIGDVVRIGTSTLQVLQPRSPCYKLQIRFERPDMTALFFHQAKPGWYASVLDEGTFSADDDIVLVDRAPEGITIADIWRYSAQAEVDRTTVERVRSLKLLPDFWKNRISRDLRN